MEKIARFGGYPTFRAGNSQYGRLCGRLARQLGYVAAYDQTEVIASLVKKRDTKGHGQWRMDGVVANALESIAWVRRVTDEEPPVNGDSADLVGATETERIALIKARVGQGIFRTDVIALWGGCAVTGCSSETVLVASHILPWNLATNSERLDPCNGLLLTPNLDKLLDRFWISFNDDGSILLSRNLTSETKSILGVTEKTKLRFVLPPMQAYLKRHRREFLRKENM